MHQEKEKDQFSKILLDATDEGLLLLLGENSRKAVYYHLEKDYSLEKNDIPKKPESFADGLKKIFGAGSSVIEKFVLVSFYSKLGLKFEEKKRYGFADYIKGAKEKLEKSRNLSKRTSEKASISAQASSRRGGKLRFCSHPSSEKVMFYIQAI